MVLSSPNQVSEPSNAWDDESAIGNGRWSSSLPNGYGLPLSGVRNCCGGCNTAIKKALATVDGIDANTAKPKQTSLVVEGDFDAAALVKALNEFGFHVQAKP